MILEHRNFVKKLVFPVEILPANLVFSGLVSGALALIDPLATAQGTTNILLLHTDLMGTVGTISIEPGVAQTAYGLLSDLVDITRTL